MPAKKKWLSAYLYYSGPGEHFFVSGLKPFADDILKRKIASGFFFIRYWEQGFHLRLRFKGNETTLQNELKPLLSDYFTSYFSNYPSLRKDTSQGLRSNNSIYFTEYEPEVERYGGPRAILLAEKQFECSSKTVLNIMKENASWNYEQALAAAIQMHIGFAHAAKMNKEEACEFFNYVFKLWVPFTYRQAENDVDAESNKKQEVFKTFEKMFNEQKEMLLPFHASIWSGLDAGGAFEQKWFSKWLRSSKTICRNLAKLQEKDLLFFKPDISDLNEFKTEFAKRVLWPIYGSYVHMTNNRLGILNSDEGYLAYLMSKSLG